MRLYLWLLCQLVASEGVLHAFQVADTSICQVGSTPHSYSTTGHGSASFSIPIPGPPSSGSVGPHLSIDYDNAQHPLALSGGAGVSISGLPYIHRIPQTTVQDGKQRAVQLDEGDRFAFNGQRMVNVSGAYGANGTLYGTESMSFVRIVSFSDPASNITNGPSHFNIIMASGTSYCLGCTADSQFLPAGRSDVVLTWAMSREEDRFGNYYTATYTSYPGAGANVLHYVNYTGNTRAQTTPHSSIEFVYEPRPDVFPSFVAGYETQALPVRLSTVNSLSLGVQAYSLVLQYTQSCSSGASLLSSAQLFGNDSTWCYNPVLFTWADSCTAPAAPPTLALPPVAVDASAPIAQQQFEASRIREIDWDNDQVMDFFVINGWGSNATATIYVNKGNGQYTTVVGPSIWVSADYTQGGIDMSRVFLVDWNGDGLPDVYIATSDDNTYGGASYDLIYLNLGGVAVAATPIAGPLTVVRSDPTYAPVDLSRYKFADFDGNGIVDLLYAQDVSTGNSPIFLGFPTGISQVQGPALNVSDEDISATLLDLSRIRPVQLDADTRSDLFIQQGTNSVPTPALLLTSSADAPQGTVQFTPVLSNLLLSVSEAQAQAANDIARVSFIQANLDKCADVYEIVPGNNVGIVHLNLCNGTFDSSRLAGAAISTRLPVQQFALDLRRVVYYDFNADGVTDIVWLTGDGQANQVFTGRAGGYNSTGIMDAITLNFSSSILGEAAAYLACVRLGYWSVSAPEAGFAILNLATPVVMQSSISPTTLTTITDGFGAVMSIQYSTLADPSVHVRTQPNASVYPVRSSNAVTTQVVQRTDAPDGLGGLFTTLYHGGGMLEHIQGLGSLGYAWFAQTKVATGQLGNQSFSQQWTTRSQGHEISRTRTWLTTRVTDSETQHTLQTWQPSPSVFAVVEGATTEVTRDPISGVWMSTAVASYKYDAYLNVLHMERNTTDTSGWHWAASDRTYAQNLDPSVWIIGVPTTQVESASSSAHPQVAVRTTLFAYDLQYGYMLNSTYMPGEPTIERTVAHTYNAFGLMETQTTSGPSIETRVSSTSYDALGRFPMLEVNALGFQTAFAYNPQYGIIANETDLNELSAQSVVDGMGRAIGTLYPDGTSAWTNRTWAANGGITTAGILFESTSTGRCGEVTRVHHDLLGRSVRKIWYSSNYTNTHVLAVVVDTVYNAAGQVASTSEPFFAAVDPAELPYPATNEYSLTGQIYWTYTQYDAVQRPIITTLPDGTTQRTVYNTYNITRIDGRGNPAVTITNALGERLYTADALGSVISFNYTPFHTVLQVTNPDGTVVQYTLDAVDRVVGVSDPDRGNTTFVLNALGQTLQIINGNGETVKMTYDVAGRMIERGSADEYTVWIYDTAEYGRGKLSSVTTQPAGYVQSIKYNALSQPILTQISINSSTLISTVTYDQCSRAATTTLNLNGVYLGSMTNVFHNTTGQIYARLGDADDPVYSTVFWEQMSVDARGNSIQESFGFQLTAQYTYDPANANLLSTIVQKNMPQYDIFSRQYTYDANRNLVSRSNSIQGLSESFAYDALNRLISSNASSWNANTPGVPPVYVTYNAGGSIASRSDAGVYGYGNGDNSHQLTSISSGPAAGFTFKYDATGRNTYDGLADVALTYWAGSSRVKQLLGNNAVWSYMYGADATTPVMETFDGPTGRTLVQRFGSLEVVTAPSGSTTCRLYVAAVIRNSNCTFQFQPQNDIYTFRDVVGSLDTIINPYGQVLDQQSFDFFGRRRDPATWLPFQPLNATMPLDQYTMFGFSGHEQVALLGLVHMKGRTYNPMLGRMMQADPLIHNSGDSQDTDPYMYARNNFLMITDPSGRSWISHLVHHVESWFHKEVTSLVQKAEQALNSRVMDLVKGLVAKIPVGGWIAALSIEAAQLTLLKVEGESWHQIAIKAASDAMALLSPTASFVLTPIEQAVMGQQHGVAFWSSVERGYLKETVSLAIKDLGVQIKPYETALSNDLSAWHVNSWEQSDLSSIIQSAARGAWQAALTGASIKQGLLTGFKSGVQSVTADVEHQVEKAALIALGAPSSVTGSSFSNSGFFKSAAVCLGADIESAARQGMLGVLSSPVSAIAGAAAKVVSSAGVEASLLYGDISAMTVNLASLGQRVSQAMAFNPHMQREATRLANMAVGQLCKLEGSIHEFVGGAMVLSQNLGQLASLASQSQVSIPLDRQMATLYYGARGIAAMTWRNLLDPSSSS